MKVSGSSQSETNQGEKGGDWMNDQEGGERVASVRRKVEIAIFAFSTKETICRADCISFNSIKNCIQ